MLNSQQQVQSFGDIALGDGNVFTVNQILQVTASAIQTRPLNPTSPYRGLKKFEFNHKDFFFGRDRLIANLIEIVSQSNFILLLGASGSGKSSLVRAGIIPQLAERLGAKFRDFTFTPDRNPFESFRISLIGKGYKQSEVESAFDTFKIPLNQGIHALKEKDSQWLIFIDQFEEVFTLCQDLEQRKKFIDNLVAIAKSNRQSVKIILAMRADFLDRFSPYPNLGKIAQQNIHLVTDMHPDELRQAIEQPAAHQGVIFEAGLVEEIIRDIQGQAGSLPLLQYTLDLLWQHEDISDRTLNIKTYRELGGVRGALQSHVECIYQHLKPQEQLAAKQIFLRLIDLTATEKEFNIVGKAVSRRAHLTEFDNQLVQGILDRLIDSNLLVTNRQEQSTVEIAHEILINSWSTLKEWIEDSKEALAIRNRLSEDAQRWQDAGKPADELWSGSKLQRVEELRQKQEFDRLGGLSQLENQFIDASIAERDRRLWEAETRRKQQLIAVSGTSIIFAGLALLAGVQWHQAERQKTILWLRERANQATNLLNFNPVAGVTSAIALTGESIDRFGDRSAQILPQVRSSLRDAIAVSTERNALRGHQGAVWASAFSPDGQIIASGSIDKTIRLWDKSGKPIGQPFQGHQQGVFSIAFSPDGQYIVSGSADGTVRLWDRSGQAMGQPFQGHANHIKSVAFSPDGKYIVSGGDDGTVRLWNLQGNPVGQPIQTRQGQVWSVAFSPDGQYIASGGTNNTIRLWDKQGNSRSQPFRGHQDHVFAVSFSPDGKAIASGSADNTIRLWDLRGNALGQPFTGHEDFVRSVTFSPDGKYILSGSDDKTIRLWDLKGHQIGQPLIGHEYYLYSVGFSPDGETIISSSEDNTVRLWNRANFQLDRTLTGHQDKVLAVAMSPDGQYVASSSADKIIQLWDKSGNPLAQLQGHQGAVNSIAISSDGQYIASGSDDRTIRLWNKQGAIARPFQGHAGDVFSVAISPDGQLIISGSADGTIRLWDKQGNAIARPFQGHEGGVFSVAISPDGQQIISGGNDKTIRVWDLKGNPIGQPWRGHPDEVHSVAFSPDGKYVVSGSRDRTVRLWDRQGNAIGQPFLGHGSLVTSVAFSPNGEYIVSGSRDRTVRLWDLQGNAIGQPMQKHEASVTSIAISPDGQHIVSGSWDKTVQLWQGGSFSTWLKTACNKLQAHSILTTSATETAKIANKTCQIKS
ncbi:nSTAND1 domain-containing NTPase [Chroococcidiopsis sp.]|uniref:nSTAND1 domain-containing NTPase n=1 Tax=Chroococcidiopsis sp. TaxID=3088168 RepID=UPI003F3F79ED